MRRGLVLLAMLCLLPAGGVHGDGDGREMFEERLLEGALGPMDLHGTLLAWAAMRDGVVQLVVTDLADASEVVVTSFEAIGQEPVQSLTFDGRWVAWTDVRFGNLDAFAIDTETGRLLRLSDHFLDDRDIDVEDGRFAWVRGAVMVSDDAGQIQAIPGSGAAFEPTFAGGWLIWSQVEGQRRVIRGQYLADGTVHTLADDEGIIHKDLAGAPDGHVLWAGVAGEAARIYARKIDSDGTLGETQVLTGWGTFGTPETGGGHGAWSAATPPSLQVVRLSDLQGDTTASVLSPLLSSDLLVLVFPDPAGIRLEPTTWGAWGVQHHAVARDSRPILVVAGVALLVVSAGFHWFRTRQRTS